MLLYATDRDAERHEPSRIWFEDQMNSGTRIGLPWFTLLSFVSEAHVVALAIEHGLTLYSADAGLRMFPGLKLHNPLE